MQKTAVQEGGVISLEVFLPLYSLGSARHPTPAADSAKSLWLLPLTSVCFCLRGFGFNGRERERWGACGRTPAYRPRELLDQTVQRAESGAGRCLSRQAVRPQLLHWNQGDLLFG